MMSNDLLPNNSFLYKIKKAESPQCTFCGKFDGRLHFLACLYSGGVGEAVLNILVETTENKLKQLKVIELDTVQTSCPPRSVHPLRGWHGANGTKKEREVDGQKVQCGS